MTERQFCPMKSHNDNDDDNVTVMFADVHDCSSNVITSCMCVIDSDYIPVLHGPDMDFYMSV